MPNQLDRNWLRQKLDEIFSALPKDHSSCVAACKQDYQNCVFGCDSSSDNPASCRQACHTTLESCINGCPNVDKMDFRNIYAKLDELEREIAAKK